MSGLAAVHLAANAGSTALIPPVKPEIATADAPASTAAKPGTTVADLVSAYPDLCIALRTEGATAERTRILGIEAHAMAGHEALITSMKADPAVTPDMAAGRILAAERAGRATQLKGIQDVEAHTGKVPASPTSAPSASAVDEKASTPEGWEKEYAASEKLQGEFPTAADYVALKKAEASGRVRVLHGAASK